MDVKAGLQQLIEAKKRFRCIYIDPPWAYANQGTRAATGNHYSGLSVDALCALPIGSVADADCHLHLWTTNGFLFDCQSIMAAWGFEYKSAFIWVKPQMGLGNYWRVSHEYLLLGKRGNPKFKSRALKSWGEFRRNRHSEKPEQVRRLIEKASEGPYLEVFARRQTDGRTALGDQIEETLL